MSEEEGTGASFINRLAPHAAFAVGVAATGFILHLAFPTWPLNEILIAALAGVAIAIIIALQLVGRFWKKWSWEKAFERETSRTMGIDHVYNTLQEAEPDIIRDIEKAQSIRLFVQLGRYILGGPHSLLYEHLKKRSPKNVSIQILHATKNSSFLEPDRLRKRGTNVTAIQGDIDHLQTLILSLRDEAGVQVESRQHQEPYLWRLLFFDNIAYVSGYLYDKDNDQLAFVYRIADGPQSLYKIFHKYFEYLWEKYPPVYGTLEMLIPQTAVSGAVVLLRKGDKNVFMVFDRTQEINGKHIYRFAALGGKRLPSERWVDCALREAHEETSGSITIIPAPKSVYFDLSKKLNPTKINEDPTPLGVMETADESIGVKSGWGKRYTVVYMASFDGQMRNRSEVRGFLKVSNELLLKMAQTEMTFDDFIRQGGEMKNPAASSGVSE